MHWIRFSSWLIKIDLNMSYSKQKYHFSWRLVLLFVLVKLIWVKNNQIQFSFSSISPQWTECETFVRVAMQATLQLITNVTCEISGRNSKINGQSRCLYKERARGIVQERHWLRENAIWLRVSNQRWDGSRN